MIPRYFQAVFLIDTCLDREITGWIPSKFSLSSFEMAIHYVEFHQVHVRSLPSQYSVSLIIRLLPRDKCKSDINLPPQAMTNLCGRLHRYLDKFSYVGIESKQVSVDHKPN